MVQGIQYIVILGKRDSHPLAVIPSQSLNHPLLRNLGYYPHSFEHFVYGADYYQAVLLSGASSGHKVVFVYADDLETLNGNYIHPNALHVFMICTEQREMVIRATIELARYHHPQNSVYLVSAENKPLVVLSNTFSTDEEFWEFLYVYTRKHMDIDEMRAPFCVPCFAQMIDEPLFLPAVINTQTMNSMVGNWGYHRQKAQQEIQHQASREAIEAVKFIDSFVRQNILTEQIKKLYAIEKEARRLFKVEPRFRDQFYAPLILALPYNSRDTRKAFANVRFTSPKDEKIAKDLEFVLSQEQTRNYCFTSEFERFRQQNPGVLGSLIQYLLQSRSLFLDFVGQLHATFRFSPYLRLPLQGIGINRELSFVGAQLNSQLTFSNNRQSMIKIITNIGNMLEANTLSPETKEMLKQRPCQIVAFSDLPVEWINIDSIPLGFTHDICRLAESPIDGLLTHHQINLFNKYKVPRDIIQKTLVVFGCRDDAFRRWQDKADQSSRSLGFKTCICNSLNALAENIRRFKPEFLIIDSHGGTDLSNHQSYIYMGTEKVYPKDIVEKGITAPLVFISACNTAPTYNSINTIANALFEVGSLVVTSAYMPLDIKDSSILYLRILNQLSQAATHFYHKNWLAFISHILRTSFILSPLIKDNNWEKAKEKEIVNNTQKIGETLALSMLVENRRKLYEDLHTGKILNELNADYSNITPHYLLYSTQGRADLIEFECFSPERWSATQHD